MTTTAAWSGWENLDLLYHKSADLSDEALLWEFRSLDGWDGKAFPASAMATVVYEGRRGDGDFSEWSEAADSFGVPAYLPSRDGQLRLARRRGRWHLSTFVEEQLWIMRKI